MIDHTIRVRRKGQMTLPAEVREDLSLDDGDLIHLRKVDGNYVLSTAADWVDSTAGALSKYAKGEPPVTQAEMDKAVEDGILESWVRFVRETEAEYDK